MEEKTFCVKCQEKTNTIDPKVYKTKNNRDLVKGICKVCGKLKSCFIKWTIAE